MLLSSSPSSPSSPSSSPSLIPSLIHQHPSTFVPSAFPSSPFSSSPSSYVGAATHRSVFPSPARCGPPTPSFKSPSSKSSLILPSPPPIISSSPSSLTPSPPKPSPFLPLTSSPLASSSPEVSSESSVRARTSWEKLVTTAVNECNKRQGPWTAAEDYVIDPESLEYHEQTLSELKKKGGLKKEDSNRLVQYWYVDEKIIKRHRPDLRGTECAGKDYLVADSLYYCRKPSCKDLYPGMSQQNWKKHKEKHYPVVCLECWKAWKTEQAQPITLGNSVVQEDQKKNKRARKKKDLKKSPFDLRSPENFFEHLQNYHPELLQSIPQASPLPPPQHPPSFKLEQKDNVKAKETKTETETAPEPEPEPEKQNKKRKEIEKEQDLNDVKEPIQKKRKLCVEDQIVPQLD